MRDNFKLDIVQRRYADLLQYVRDARSTFSQAEIQAALNAAVDELREDGNPAVQDYEEFVKRRAEEREEKKRELEREQEENRINAGISRNRDRWLNLEQYINQMDRNRWLVDAARTKSRFGMSFEGIPTTAGLNRLQELIPAIDFVERGQHLDFPPQIKEWERCRRCIYINEDGDQCDRFASCHRTHPSRQFCWQHAKKAHQENDANPDYQRRVGLV